MWLWIFSAQRIHQSRSLRGQPPSPPESLCVVEGTYVVRLRSLALCGVALCFHNSPGKDRCWLIFTILSQATECFDNNFGTEIFPTSLVQRLQLLSDLGSAPSFLLFHQSDGGGSGQEEAQALQKTPQPWDWNLTLQILNKTSFLEAGILINKASVVYCYDPSYRMHSSPCAGLRAWHRHPSRNCWGFFLGL